VEVIRLLTGKHTKLTADGKYYNPERQILQHYLFPQIFIRRTKAIYLSIGDDQIVGIAQNIGKVGKGNNPHPSGPKEGNYV